MKCIAIDDEPIALQILSEYCERRGDIELQTFSSPVQGLQAVLSLLPDVVFLDIEMNGISGIDLARKLPKSICLIFTTAYAKYALDGYELNAVDFLHKPFFYERFDRAMQKAEQWLEYNSLRGESGASAGKQIVIKSDYKNVPVSLSSILFIESIDNYVKIHLSDEKSITSKMTLHSVMAMLPEDEFVRIHRSFLIPVKRVEHFTRSEVVLQDGGKTLPIGKTYADEVVKLLSK